MLNTFSIPLLLLPLAIGAFELPACTESYYTTDKSAGRGGCSDTLLVTTAAANKIYFLKTPHDTQDLQRERMVLERMHGSPFVPQAMCLGQPEDLIRSTEADSGFPASASPPKHSGSHALTASFRHWFGHEQHGRITPHTTVRRTAPAEVNKCAKRPANGPFLLMEYVHAYDAYEWAYKRSQLDTMRTRLDVMDVLLQMARSVQALHLNDIIHNDLKPKNFLVSDCQISPKEPQCRSSHKAAAIRQCFTGAAAGKRGIKVRVIDFGSAMLAGDETVDFRTIPRSPIFIPPEIKEGLAPTFKSDVYSFGMAVDDVFTLFRNGFSEEEVAKVNALVESMKEEDPDLRPSMDEVVFALEKSLGRFLCD